MPEALPQTEYEALLRRARAIEEAASVGGLVAYIMTENVQLELF